MSMLSQKSGLKSVGKKAGVNALAGVTATGIYFLSRIALTPIVLSHISLSEFGLWSICFVILSYAAVGAVGINNAYVKFTAQHHAEQDMQAINHMASTGIVCMTIFSAGFYLVLELAHPSLLTLFRIDPASRELAGFMVMGTTLVFCIDFTMGCFRSILEGLQEIALSKGVNVGASVFEVILIVIFLSMGAGVKGLLYAYGIKTAAEMVICGVLVYRKLPGFKIRISYFNKLSFRQMYVYVGKVQVLGAIAVFNASLGRFMVASFIGLAGTGLFEVARKFPFTGRNISRAAFAPFFPAASYMGGRWQRGDTPPAALRGKKYLAIFFASLVVGICPVLIILFPPVSGKMPGTWISIVAVCCLVPVFFLLARWLYSKFMVEDRLMETELQALYLKGLRYLTMLNVTVFGFLMVIARPLIVAWVGPDYLEAIPVMVIISLTNMIHQSTGPASLVFKGIDRTGREFEFLIIEFATALCWVSVGTYCMGITGTALGIFASSTSAGLYFFWRTNYAFQISWNNFLKKVIFPVAAPLLSALVVYGLTLVLPTGGRISAAIQVMGLGSLHLVLTFFLLWRLFLSKEESGFLFSMIKRRIPGQAGAKATDGNEYK